MDIKKQILGIMCLAVIVGVMGCGKASKLTTLANKAPTAITIVPATKTLSENRDTSSRIQVATINISDDGLGTNILKSTGIDNSIFEIVEQNKLYLKAGTSLNYEIKSTYNVVVEVNDSTVGASPNVTANFILTVADSNESPDITGDSSFDVTENHTTVTTIASSDPDTLDTLTYSLIDSADKSKFSIDTNSGVLTFRTTPNYEVPTDTDNNNKYELIVQVTDSGSLTATKSVLVEVANDTTTEYVYSSNGVSSPGYEIRPLPETSNSAWNHGYVTDKSTIDAQIAAWIEEDEVVDSDYNVAFYDEEAPSFGESEKILYFSDRLELDESSLIDYVCEENYGIDDSGKSNCITELNSDDPDSILLAAFSFNNQPVYTIIDSDPSKKYKYWLFNANSQSTTHYYEVFLALKPGLSPEVISTYFDQAQEFLKNRFHFNN